MLPYKTCGVAGALCYRVETTCWAQKALGQWEGTWCCLSTSGGVCWWKHCVLETPLGSRGIQDNEVSAALPGLGSGNLGQVRS